MNGSKQLTRDEWERFVEKTLLDLYSGQVKALELQQMNNENIQELGRIVSRLADVVDRRCER